MPVCIRDVPTVPLFHGGRGPRAVSVTRPARHCSWADSATVLSGRCLSPDTNSGGLARGSAIRPGAGAIEILSARNPTAQQCDLQQQYREDVQRHDESAVASGYAAAALRAAWAVPLRTRTAPRSVRHDRTATSAGLRPSSAPRSGACCCALSTAVVLRSWPAAARGGRRLLSPWQQLLYCRGAPESHRLTYIFIPVFTGT